MIFGFMKKKINKGLFWDLNNTSKDLQTNLSIGKTLVGFR